MRVVPERPTWSYLVTFVVGFLAGPLSGLQLGLRLAPDSDIVHGVAITAFAGIFIGGLLFWMGLGVAVVLVQFVASLVRGRRPGPENLPSSDRIVPPGYQAFVVLGAGLGLMAGLVAGLLTELSVPVAGVIWMVIGLAYGLALWTAAHHGYLPFPEPE